VIVCIHRHVRARALRSLIESMLWMIWPSSSMGSWDSMSTVIDMGIWGGWNVSPPGMRVGNAEACFHFSEEMRQLLRSLREDVA
jgi:hypothetical protein